MYIHNIYNNMQVSEFGEEKIFQQSKIALEQIDNLNMKFKKELEAKTNNAIEYTKLLEELAGKIQQAADKSMEELKQISGTAVREAIDKAIAKKNMNQDITAELDEVNRQIKNLRESFDSFESSYKTAASILPSPSDLNKIYIANKATLDQAHHVIQAALNNPTFKRLSLEGFGKRKTDKSLASLRSFISQITQYGMLSNKNLAKPATAIGYLAEGVFSNAMNDVLSSFEMNGFSIQASATGDQSGYIQGKRKQIGFKYKTSDISLELVDKSGKIMMTLPGISLKRTGAYDRNSKGDMLANIHVKSSNLGNMLNTARISNKQQQHIYNLIANNGRAAKKVSENDGSIGELYYHKNIDLNNMYRWIYAATLLASFAGNLTMSDFAQFWIVNNKIYTAPEIIEAAFKGQIPAGDKGHKVFLRYIDDASKSGIAVLAADIPQKHSEIFDQLLATSKASMWVQGQQRSQKILNAMQTIKYSMHLRVNINALLNY